MNSEENKAWSCIGIVFGLPLIVAVLLVYGYVVDGYVLSMMWGWFIVPVFHLPTLSIVQAIGVGMVVSFLVRSYFMAKEDINKKSKWEKVGYCAGAIISPWLTLLIGWFIYTTWMMPK